ncbi:hypothetical protein Tco_0465689, partial [Tanacetum coccineum]
SSSPPAVNSSSSSFLGTTNSNNPLPIVFNISALTKAVLSGTGFALGIAAIMSSSSETVIKFARDMEKAGEIGACIESMLGSAYT